METYYVGVFLSQKVLFPVYGFTDYVDCYCEAKEYKEAEKIASDYFRTKYRVNVTGTRASVTTKQNVLKYASKEQIICPGKALSAEHLTQTALF